MDFAREEATTALATTFLVPLGPGAAFPRLPPATVPPMWLGPGVASLGM